MFRRYGIYNLCQMTGTIQIDDMALLLPGRVHLGSLGNDWTLSETRVGTLDDRITWCNYHDYLYTSSLLSYIDGIH